MTVITPGVVDVYVIRPDPGAWKVLLLKRSSKTRCPGAWEAVHGHVEGNEAPEHCAVREVHEETALSVTRLYNVTVQPFYLHKISTIQMAVVFAAFAGPEDVVLSDEHVEFEWLDVAGAMARFAWPREVAALKDIIALLGTGDAGAVEDVLRVF